MNKWKRKRKDSLIVKFKIYFRSAFKSKIFYWPDSLKFPLVCVVSWDSSISDSFFPSVYSLLKFLPRFFEDSFAIVVLSLAIYQDSHYLRSKLSTKIGNLTRTKLKVTCRGLRSLYMVVNGRIRPYFALLRSYISVTVYEAIRSYKEKHEAKRRPQTHYVYGHLWPCVFKLGEEKQHLLDSISEKNMDQLMKSKYKWIQYKSVLNNCFYFFQNIEKSDRESND